MAIIGTKEDNSDIGIHIVSKQSNKVFAPLIIKPFWKIKTYASYTTYVLNFYLLWLSLK